MKKVHLMIDGQELAVPADWTILEAARDAKIKIPTLCYHPELEVFNSCLLCVVQIEGMARPVLSCGTVVRDGMVVDTRNKLIRETRRMALELLVSEHCGDCIAPCRYEGCPAYCDIQGFIRRIAQKDFAGALRVIKEDIPLPAALGRVCPAPCEDECRRHRVEEAVSICSLKRFPADWDLEQEAQYLPHLAPDTGHQVAIVGAGPAGLSAAYYLRQMGHAVTIYEAQEKPGGMLLYGIPAYRLPHDELAAEIKTITDLGIEVQYNMAVGSDVSLEELQQKYQAIFLGIGAQNSRMMRIPGEDSGRVWGGVEFLGEVARGKDVEVGNRVVVVGGGDSAIDAVRTALRLGARSSIFYRRSRQEMPALDIEVEEAEEEGVELNFLVTPIAITETDSGLVVTNVRMELGKPDASGRRRPIPIKGSEFDVECDTLIMAIGQVIDSGFMKGSQVEISRWGGIIVDEKTLQTSVPGIFAGGDGVTGPDIAVRAVAAGHRAAFSIDQYLQGQEVVGRPKPWNSAMGKLEEVTEARFAHVAKAERAKMPHLELSQRSITFEEITLGFPAGTAIAEAERCLACGCAAVDECQLREYAIEYGVDPLRFTGSGKEYSLDNSHPDLVHEAGKCIQCGMCVRVCQDVKELNVFTFVNRGFEAQVLPYFGLPLGKTVCDGCLKCVEVCPTGSLMARADSFVAFDG